MKKPIHKWLRFGASVVRFVAEAGGDLFDQATQRTAAYISLGVQYFLDYLEAVQALMNKYHKNDAILQEINENQEEEKGGDDE